VAELEHEIVMSSKSSASLSNHEHDVIIGAGGIVGIELLLYISLLKKKILFPETL
jgi:hypothetical protein